MVSGQLKVVRYYPYFQKAFESMRALIVSQYDDLTPRQMECAAHYKPLQAPHHDGRDFWSPLCARVKHQQGIMEGTTYCRANRRKHGFEFNSDAWNKASLGAVLAGAKPPISHAVQDYDIQRANATEIATIAAKIFSIG